MPVLRHAVHSIISLTAGTVLAPTRRVDARSLRRWLALSECETGSRNLG